MAAVVLDQASVDAGGVTALDGVDLAIADGEFVAVIGPSGSGKTSLLRAIAGLATVRRGRVLIGGRDVTGLAPGDRDVAMVFQQSALLPRRSVRRNISFPLELRRQPVAEIRQRVDAEVRALHIEALLERDPTHLAVGESQLVQIARSMVRVPQVLLLDEPFAHLDEHVRAALRAEIGMLQRGYGVTTIMATNEGVDAMTLADRVVVLDRGRVIQVAAPDAVRRSPASLTAAAAAGDVSCFPAELLSDADGHRIVRRSASGVVEFRHPVSSDEQIGEHREVTVAVRPSDVLLDPSGPINAVVERHVPGTRRSISCGFAGVRVEVAVRPPAPEVGSRVRLRIRRVLVFDPITENAVARGGPGA